ESPIRLELLVHRGRRRAIVLALLASRVHHQHVDRASLGARRLQCALEVAESERARPVIGTIELDLDARPAAAATAAPSLLALELERDLVAVERAAQSHVGATALTAAAAPAAAHARGATRDL